VIPRIACKSLVVYVLTLVYPNVINEHLGGELHVGEVLSLEIWRHAEVHDDVLQTKVGQCGCMEQKTNNSREAPLK
jgi:hypothetical protein